MNGLDPVAATALTARVDSLLTALGTAGRDAASTGTAVQGGAVQGATTGVDPTVGGTAASTEMPAGTASTAASLSSVARTLDFLARFGGPTAPPLAGRTPLLSAAPTGAAAGVADSAPPAGLTAALASALTRSVSSSGVFYESHLAQWLTGTRSLADLAQEPQAALGNGATAAQGGAGGTNGAQTPGEALAAFSTGLTGIESESGTPQALSGRALPGAAPAAGAMGAGSLPGGERAFQSGSPPSTRLPASHVDATGVASGSPGTPGMGADRSGNAATTPGLALPVHPATLPIVRHQLDMLHNPQPQFRWSGEAWPGATLQWEVEPDPAEREHAANTDSAARTWRTRVTLELPTLGRVDAELSLTGHRLSARISSASGADQQLAAASQDLRRGVAAAGMDLQALTIATGASAPAASAGFAADLASAWPENRTTGAAALPASDASWGPA